MAPPARSTGRRSVGGTLAAAAALAAGALAAVGTGEAWLNAARLPSSRLPGDGYRGRGDSASAVQRRSTARQAEAVCQEALLMMDNGKAPPDKIAVAVKLIHEAAQDGSHNAMTVLGTLYSEGQYGVPLDMEEGYKWMDKGCKAGNDLAAYNLGIIHYTGKGKPVEKFLAAKYMKQAGELGNVQAMMHLAQMLMQGDGIVKDVTLGAQWLVRGAQKTGQVEEIMEKIQQGTLDRETAEAVQENVKKLLDYNQRKQFLQWDTPTPER